MKEKEKFNSKIRGVTLSRGSLLEFGEDFEREFFEILLVVFNSLPLSSGTSFNFSTLTNFVL